MKDKLDAFNNSKSNCEETPGGGGGQNGGGNGDDDDDDGKDDDDDDDNSGGGSGGHDDCKHSQKCKTKSDCERKAKAGSTFRSSASRR